MDHSTLSQLLRERRPLTERAIRLIGRRLKLAPEVVESFVSRERSRKGSSPVLGQLRQLTGDAAGIVIDPTHYAILELLRLKQFRADSRWIARALGISIDDVNMALSRLLRLGLIEMSGAARWEDKTGGASANLDEFTLVAIHQLVERVARLRSRALSDIPARMRDHSSATLAVETAKIPAAADLIRRFREELGAFLTSGDKPDDVYQLEISLFPVTTLAKPKERKANAKSRRTVSDRVKKA